MLCVVCTLLCVGVLCVGALAAVLTIAAAPRKLHHQRLQVVRPVPPLGCRYRGCAVAIADEVTQLLGSAHLVVRDETGAKGGCGVVGGSVR